MDPRFPFFSGGIWSILAPYLSGSWKALLFAVGINALHGIGIAVQNVAPKYLLDGVLRRDILSHLQFMKQESCSYLFFVLLCCLGAWRFLHHGLTAGELLAYLGCFTALQGPLQQIFQIGVAKGSAMASLERIQVVLDTASTTPDPAEALAAPTGGQPIHFEHVTFSYATRPNLIDFNLTMPYGQRIALVGPSGAGKSTVVQLLLRLYDPQARTVRLGETPLSACRGADVRKLFGVVPQAPCFFQASIRENLLLVRPDATQADIIEACQRAHAWEFIEKLPDRLDTPMSEGGSTLSGGQRQRLAIARVLLFDPPFFIFDEATSALDTVSERLIDERCRKPSGVAPRSSSPTGSPPSADATASWSSKTARSAKTPATTTSLPFRASSAISSRHRRSDQAPIFSWSAAAMRSAWRSIMSCSGPSINRRIFGSVPE